MRRDSINALFNLRAQLRQLAVNLHFLKEELLGAGAALLVALLILACYTAKASLRNLASAWFGTLPVIAVFGMYLLIHLVTRFVLGFSLVLWASSPSHRFVRLSDRQN